MIPSRLAQIAPPVAVAGAVGTWTLTYRIADRRLAAGDRLVIDTDSDTDWEEPQTTRPNQSGYLHLEILEPPAATVAVQVCTVRRIELRVIHGQLPIGTVLRLAFGAGAGMRMQTFAEPRRFFRLTRLYANGERYAEPDPPFLRVTGGVAARLVIVGPSVAVAGASVSILLKAEDTWGNPATALNELVTFTCGAFQWRGTMPADSAVQSLTVPLAVVTERTVIRAQASCGTLTAVGNPIVVAPAGQNSHPTQYWGDFHGGQLMDVRKLPDYYQYARDVSGIQFCSYQRNDHEMTDPEWAQQQTTDAEFNQPGRFVALPGYEWSAETHLGGDRTVLFPRHGLPLLRSSYDAVEGETPDPLRELRDQTALYNHYRLTDVVLVPHVGGRPANLGLHDPQLEPIVEIASTHGTFEWFYRDALRRGYKVGVVAGSDGYTGRPGAEYPGHIARRFSRSGSAAVRATQLDLPGILAAARARHTYATSGPRIYLDTRITSAGMGDETVTTAPPTIEFAVHGTAAIEQIDLYRRDQCIQSRRSTGGLFRGRYRVLMNGSAAWRCYTGVQWIGALRLSAGNISDLTSVRFDSPRSTVALDGPRQIVWDTINCGYAHGFEFRVDPVDRTVPTIELSVENHLFNDMFPGEKVPTTMRISRARAERVAVSGRLPVPDSGSDPLRLSLGPAERWIVVEPVFEELPWDVESSFTDLDSAPGVNPYWIKVTQRDQHNAWSSPIFVHFEKR